MKIFKCITAVITASLILIACQKELDFQIDGISHGALKKDASGDCLPSTVNGIFKEDSLLNTNNFIDIQVAVTVIGTYDIKSDTVNGYSFRGNGNFDSVGMNTVRLFGIGKPLSPGTDQFTISFDSSTCVVDVIVINSGTGPATYSLEGSPGTCSGAIVNGTYMQGTALDINNTISISVNVTDTGTYTLGAASANGMVFSSIGVFNSTGIQPVILNGTGTPTSAGIINVTSTNGTSSCTFSITVLPAGGGGVSVFTLDATAGNCSGATYAGTYSAGTPLTAANTVVINVTVVSSGTYFISSNTVNGVTFSATGTFTTTGPQPVTLTGSGTPVNGGIFNYDPASGASTCSFSITFTGTPVNEDYIPETSFSNYSDRYVGGLPSDTSYTQVSPNSIVINARTYKIFEEKELGIPVDSTFHRKVGGMYYVIFDDSYGLDNNFNVDGLVLDSSLAINATWMVDLGNNTWNGLPATSMVMCTILDKGAVAIIAGNTYTNVIKVRYIFSYNVGSGDVDNYQWEIWFSKGKGMIYQKVNDIPVTSTDEGEVTRIQIF
ncbi:MAG: hypothetical protein ABIO04_14000 [Ferruginibacter sp.]